MALIVGVTGMAGLSIAESLNSPTALGGPWKVYGSARRSIPTWFPSSLLHSYISFDAASLPDTRRKLSPLSAEITHLFWVAIQVRETEEQNILVNQTMLSNVLHVLTSGSGSRLRHVTLQTGTKHYMGPFDRVLPLSQTLSLPFREDTPRLPCPNFYYAQEDLLASHSPPLAYSVHRSSIIIGASTRSFYNFLLTVAVYAAICKHEGLPFRFPGTRYAWEHFVDMTDARVLAEQQIWAAATSRAKNEAFNCTNGDVFMWKTLWKALCDVFGVEFVPFDENEEFDVVVAMEGKGKVWDEIVREHGLERTKMEEITCFGAVRYVLSFGFQHVSSMTKSREYGFFGYADTLKCIRLWVNRLRNMKFIP